MPENGQLAINPPLTPARAAALSHRSAHPYILAEINRLIRELHGTVRLHNPFQRHTKGDVCATGLDSGLRAEELAETVSCACRPARAGRVNCGWCYPCLVRRSGLQEAIGYDPSRYASSLDRLVSERSRQDLWDLQRWLSRRYTMRDLLADVPLPAEIDPQDVLATLRRGRRELARMLRRHDQWVELAE